MRNATNVTVETLESRQLMSAAANVDGRQVFGDFNGDGNVDLAAVANGRLGFSWGVTQTGSFGVRQDLTRSLGFRPLSVAGGDINGDGALDLAILGTTYGGDGEVKGIIAILIGPAADQADSEHLSLNFEKYKTTVKAPIARGLPVVGDWNGDGADDIGSAQPTGLMALFLPRFQDGTLVELDRAAAARTPYRAGGHVSIGNDDAGGPDDVLVINKNGRAFRADSINGPYKQLSLGRENSIECLHFASDDTDADFLVWRNGVATALEFDDAGVLTDATDLGLSAPAALRRRTVGIDMNADGHLDLFARGPAGKILDAAGDVGNGDPLVQA